MPRKSWEISRRHMLRGIGATMSLPLLEAMGFGGSLSAAPSKKLGGSGAAGSDGQPIRFGGFFMPNGVNKADWDIPDGKLKDSPPSFLRFEHLTEYLNVFSGLRGASSGHGRGTSCFLTGVGSKKVSNASEIDVGKRQSSIRSSQPSAPARFCPRWSWE